ncbi:type IV secretion system protein [uncultured Caulobacter sp.]|uniref:type IV secretion system protein n=1 Tax=uncultured Caulobacter sp. TaxID=158749 RepID=UPI00260F837B|nr:type IV secretion system protein [uncultured Caulobacter sp.]
MDACPAPAADAGVIRGVLSTIDCHTRVYAQSGYDALTGPQSVFPTALTILLTLYVALIGYRLMFGLGGTRLTDAPLAALKIGFVLSLALNWNTFQTLVFDVTMKAPLQLAQTIGAPAASGGAVLVSDPLGGLQVTYDELARSASALGKLAGPNPQVLRGGEAAAADALWKAQTALFMSTAGVLSIAIIAVGVLSATGPIFITLVLFESTRGLFAGWLRALLAAAFTPMMCWITTTLFLVIIDPLLVRLAQGRTVGLPDTQAAMMVSAIIFIFAAAQAALTIGASVIAGGFQIGGKRDAREGAERAAEASSRETVVISRAEQLGHVLRRDAPAGAPRATIATVSSSVTVDTRGGAAVPAFAGLARREDPYRRDAFMDRYRRMTGGRR